jgi:hypothetical protein
LNARPGSTADVSDLRFTVKKLLCGSGHGGKMEWSVPEDEKFNWRLVMTTQLLGKSQVGGLLLGYFYIWLPMEEALGIQQMLL